MESVSAAKHPGELLLSELTKRGMKQKELMLFEKKLRSTVKKMVCKTIHVTILSTERG